jgi:small subunit ribosomal protein S4
MGEPKKPKKTYKKPLVIWQSDLIAEQKILLKEYGLKNKREIWKAEGFLKKIRDQAKLLIASKTEQSKKEKEQLINKLVKLGLVKTSSELESILNLELKNVLERRLQTLVFKKNVAKSIKQARQFIVHGHVSYNNSKMNVPSFLVPADMENKIAFNDASAMANEQHPERAKEKSRREEKGEKEKLDETDIFAQDKPEEKVKKEVESKLKEQPSLKNPNRQNDGAQLDKSNKRNVDEKKKKTPTKEEKTKEVPKVEKVDEVAPTENKTKEEKAVTAGKEN